ncbi:YvcK family protein [Candidatus Nomurabacteria bacterium]|nr:YvcK family protein [Candidatus Nomurabacteria bacterium]
MDFNLDPKIVVIGGGTGSFTILSGLKNYYKNITAIVNMADDGGSTGQLRDELGVLPPGDVRQCLVALSNSPKMRDLFNYRFDSGSLDGHAFGNLFLTALEKMTGSFAEAIDVADEVLNVQGRVIPVTLDSVKLVMKTKSGAKDIVGEYQIGNMNFKISQKRPKLELTPKAILNPQARKAIEIADLIIIAPGNLYGSLAPALLVDGMGKLLSSAKAKKVFVCNLVTKPGQTDGFMVDDFASELERFVGEQFIDYVLFNNEEPSKKLEARYIKDAEYMVGYSLLAKKKHYKVRGSNLLAKELPKTNSADKIQHTRSYIRHDPDLVARELMNIYGE